ncbi:MAG TPA: cytochrome c maturation protein CcmE [Ignavibacteriaceae bacterium]|nr:cytochrome c maturation protein CcmE [Ignavibacteriaceae bacterium]
MNSFYIFLQDNAIAVVAVIVLLLWVEVFFYVSNLDRRLKKVEKDDNVKTSSKNIFFQLAGLTILTGAILYYLSLGTVFFESDKAEIINSQSEISFIGTLEKRSIETKNDTTYFSLTDQNDNSLDVVYTKKLPADFSNSKTIVLTGNISNQTLICDSIFIAKNAIYTVMVIVLIVWAGIVLFLFSIDKKTKLFENQTKG